MKKLLSKIVYVALAICFSTSLFAQTTGTLTFTYTPVSHTGYSGTKNDLAVWIQNTTGTGTGTFVKTKLRYAGNGTKDHLPIWAVNSGGTAANCLATACNKTDATSGATLTTFTTKTITWDGCNVNGTANGTVVADGTYKVTIESCWNHGTTGKTTRSFTFTKGPSTDSQTPANDANFTNITLNWVPSSPSGTIATGTISGSPFCPSGAVSVPYTITGTFTAGNVFTAQLSNAAGSFATPTTIGTVTSTTAGTISATIPAGAGVGTAYRIRVVSSAPAVTGADNGANLTINSCSSNSITTSTINGSPFCSSTSYNVSVPFTSSGTFTGTYTAQLSDAAGSFASATAIGSGSASPIAAVIPASTASGAGYLIRVVNSLPNIIGTDNGVALGINNCQALVTGTLTQSTFCSSTTYDVSVPFTNIGNVTGPFLAQLSNSTGSFASPITIGSGSASPIAAGIPSGTLTGTGYRIRISSSVAGIDGSDNGSNLSVNTCTAGLANYQTINGFELFPNPASNNLTIKCNEFSNMNFVVYDAIGRKVMDIALTANVTNLNIENLENGLFIYRITDRNKSATKTGKFSIAK